MDELTLLANALMALDDKLAACMKCGMCQSVCPVFGETMMEADVTRGKLTLLEKLAHRLIEDPDAVNEKLNRCLLCGSCQANCPSGVSILEIFMEACAIVAAYKGLSPLKKAIFRTLLPNPKLFGFLLKIGAPFQGLAMRDDNNAQGTATCSRCCVCSSANATCSPRQADPQRQDRRGELPRREKPLQGGLLPRLHGRQDLHQRFRSLPQSVRLPRSRRLSAYQLFLLRHSRPLVRRP